MKIQRSTEIMSPDSIETLFKLEFKSKFNSRTNFVKISNDQGCHSFIIKQINFCLPLIKNISGQHEAFLWPYPIYCRYLRASTGRGDSNLRCFRPRDKDINKFYLFFQYLINFPRRIT